MWSLGLCGLVPEGWAVDPLRGICVASVGIYVYMWMYAQLWGRVERKWIVCSLARNKKPRNSKEKLSCCVPWYAGQYSGLGRAHNL